MTVDDIAPPASVGPRKLGFITLRVNAGLVDEDGRVDWNDHEVPYSGGTVAGYLRLLNLEPHQVTHVIADRQLIRPADTFRVQRPGEPALEVSALESFRPRNGAVIYVIASVDGKNASIILGVVGAVIGGVIGFFVGGPVGALHGAYLGSADAPSEGGVLGLQPLDPMPLPRRLRGEDADLLAVLENHGFAGCPLFGCSMAPTFSDGDVVVLTKGEPRDGDVVVVAFPRRSRNVCGRFRSRHGTTWLEKDNYVQYPPIHLDGPFVKHEPWYVVGRVLAFFRPPPLSDPVRWSI